mmetsp:Transcript_39087/g.93814  ORF Transcript_39087/g.93814 Transcript_39087/m.93814 type:complete len:312 (-) Transcript_39087:380-1315(-)
MIRNTFLCFVDEEAAPTRRCVSVPPSAKLSRTEAVLWRKSSALSEASTVSGRASFSSIESTASTPEALPQEDPLESEDLAPALQGLLSRGDAGKTTVMVRNIPKQCTQRALLKEWLHLGFGGSIDLFYLPMEFGTMTNLGYCFLNFVSEARADEFRTRVNKHRLTWFPNSRALVTTKSRVQGFRDNFTNFRNSRVMGAAVPPEFQPIIIDPQTCREIPFPPPTRKLRKTKKVDSEMRSLNKRYFDLLCTVTDERTARLIGNQTVKGFQPQFRKASFEAVVKAAEQNPGYLLEQVQCGVAQLIAAGKLSETM